MLIFKIIIFGFIVIVFLAALIKNTNEWSSRYRQYMLDQTKKAFGDGMGWEKPWTILLSRVMIIFIGLMFLCVIYMIMFNLT